MVAIPTMTQPRPHSGKSTVLVSLPNGTSPRGSPMPLLCMRPNSPGISTRIS